MIKIISYKKLIKARIAAIPTENNLPGGAMPGKGAIPLNAGMGKPGGKGAGIPGAPPGGRRGGRIPSPTGGLMGPPMKFGGII